MKFRWISLAFLACVLSGCVSLADDITPPPGYQTPTPAPTMGPLFPASQPDLVAGAALFQESCAPCHGATGLADGAMAANLPAEVKLPKLAETSSQAVPAEWFKVVTQGRLEKFMPPFADKLSDQDRWNVVGYALTLGQDATRVEEGKNIYVSLCVNCHGEKGDQIPKANLADPQRIASRSLQEIANVVQTGVGPSMPGFADKLSADEMLSVALYTRAFTLGRPDAQALASAPATATPAEGGASSVPTTESPAATSQPNQTGGSFSGDVKMGDDSATPAGLKAVLHGFDHGANNGEFVESVKVEGEVKNGRFLFEGVEVPDGRAFYVSVEYAGANYTSEPVFATDGKTLFDLPITLYSTTTDTSLLKIEQAHVVINASEPGKITVIEFLVIGNPSKQTVVSATDGGPVVSIRLPKGYSNLQFQDGELGGRFLATEGGFADTLSVSPSTGEYQLIFGFDLPFEQKSGPEAWFSKPSLAVSVPFTMPAASVSLLLPDGMQAQGQGLADKGLNNMGGGAPYQTYAAGARQPGESLDFVLSGAPKDGSATPGSAASVPAHQPWLLALGGLGLIFIGVGVYFFWRDRAAAAEEDDDEDDEDEETEDAGASRDEILDAILALDDQRKAGNLSEQAYAERRAALRARLSERED